LTQETLPDWYELEYWFNSYTEPKWRISLAKGNENTNTGYFPKVTDSHCYNDATSQEIINEANLQSKRYIAELGQ